MDQAFIHQICRTKSGHSSQNRRLDFPESPIAATNPCGHEHTTRRSSPNEDQEFELAERREVNIPLVGAN